MGAVAPPSDEQAVSSWKQDDRVVVHPRRRTRTSASHDERRHHSAIDYLSSIEFERRFSTRNPQVVSLPPCTSSAPRRGVIASRAVINQLR